MQAMKMPLAAATLMMGGGVIIILPNGAGRREADGEAEGRQMLARSLIGGWLFRPRKSWEETFESPEKLVVAISTCTWKCLRQFILSASSFQLDQILCV